MLEEELVPSTFIHRLGRCLSQWLLPLQHPLGNPDSLETLLLPDAPPGTQPGAAGKAVHFTARDCPIAQHPLESSSQG